jgi:hypothetical protein
MNALQEKEREVRLKSQISNSLPTGRQANPKQFPNPMTETDLV